nr:TPA: orf y [Tanacetum cinerariifolium]
MVQAVGSWKPNKELPVKSKEFNVKGKQPQKLEEEKNFSNGEVKLLKELLKEKTEQVQQMIKDQAKEYYENKAVMQKQEELWQSKESLLIRDLTDALKIIDQLRDEKERLEEQKDEEIKKLKAQLQKRKEEVEVEFDIPNCLAFGTTAIIDTGASACCINKKVVPKEALDPLTDDVFFNDTGASACCINKKVVPKEALEPLTDDVFFNGLNSRQQATHKIKQGNFLIEGNKFRIPLIYAFDMNDSNGIEMLIEANFLRSMKGGIRIEGDEITIYKKVTKIKTSNQIEIAEIEELEVDEEEFLEINESIYFNQEGSKAFLEQFKPVIERLKHQGYIGEEPLKHWKKNGELCKLDIINPDVTIEDQPLKHVTPVMEDTFKKHVDSLLKIGAIRPSKSRH